MEYEYSFKVDSIDKYIEYCNKNNYKLVCCTNQIRTLYKNNGLMARITENTTNDKKILILDFKEDKMSDNDLSIRKESKEIIFDNLDNCTNILEFLDYKKDKVLNRIRYKYVNDEKNVIFEIDEYIEPDKQLVVAIEGNKDNVDRVYSELKKMKD